MFTAAVEIMNKEDVINYVWIVDEGDKIILWHPQIFVFDCDLGLIEAIELK